LDVIPDDGFILMNEYGHPHMTRDDEFEHQRFSYATAIGLNFTLLKEYFESTGKCKWLRPGADEERGIHTRLASKRPNMETDVRFHQLFDKAALEKLEEPIKKARGCVQYGRFELAADYYQQALKAQPRNWVLLNEISTFMTFQMRDPKAGIDMAKVALALNPTCSAELWNTLGDALFEFGRNLEARGAYEKAMSVNESDVRSRWSLAWVHTRQKDYPAALKVIAEALALDKTGQYRERLVQKQTEVLHRLALRNQQEYLLLLNLISKYAKKDDKKPDEPAPPAPSRPSAEREEPRLPNIL
jgi:tetratricopeptide (TPR) repeat protein